MPATATDIPAMRRRQADGQPRSVSGPGTSWAPICASIGCSASAAPPASNAGSRARTDKKPRTASSKSRRRHMNSPKPVWRETTGTALSSVATSFAWAIVPVTAVSHATPNGKASTPLIATIRSVAATAGCAVASRKIQHRNTRPPNNDISAATWPPPAENRDDPERVHVSARAHAAAEAPGIVPAASGRMPGDSPHAGINAPTYRACLAWIRGPRHRRPSPPPSPSP